MYSCSYEFIYNILLYVFCLCYNWWCVRIGAIAIYQQALDVWFFWDLMTLGLIFFRLIIIVFSSFGELFVFG